MFEQYHKFITKYRDFNIFEDKNIYNIRTGNEYSNILYDYFTSVKEAKEFIDMLY